MKKKLIHEEVSGNITGVAVDVSNELKPGADEKNYECAIVIQLRRRGHKIDVQRSFPVFYRDELVSNLKPNVILGTAVVVDPKVFRSSMTLTSRK